MKTRSRTLAPDDPRAIELARLYDKLRATYRHVLRVYRALGKDPEGEARDKPDEVYTARRLAQREAYDALVEAFDELAGGPEYPESFFWRFGTPMATIRVGDRIYALISIQYLDYDVPRDYEADFPEIVVVDLAG